MGDFGEKGNGLNMLKIKPIEELIPDTTNIVEETPKIMDEEIIFEQKEKKIIPKPTNDEKIHIESNAVENEVKDKKDEVSLKITKKKKTRKPMSEKQKAALKKGREKSLAIRRAKKLEREKQTAEKRRIRNEKLKARQRKTEEHEELIYNNREELKESDNPFKNVTHFFSMMEKYEQYKSRKNNITNKQQEQTQKPQKKTMVKQNPIYLPKQTQNKGNGYDWYFS